MVRFPKLKCVNTPIVLHGILIFGYYRYKNNTIYVYNDFKVRNKIYVIFHELLHSLLHQWGEIPELLLDGVLEGIDRRLWIKGRLKYRHVEVLVKVKL